MMISSRAANFIFTVFKADTTLEDKQAFMKINYVTDSMHSRGGSVFGGAASRGASYKGAAFNDAVPGGQSSGVMRSIKASGGKERAGEFERQNNYGNIYTSIKRNPDARVSFKGDALKAAKPLLDRCAHFAEANHVAADAMFLLPIICGLKPAILLSMAKTDDEKKKYRYQAAKSIASGFAGLAMAAVVGTAVTNGVKAAKAGKLKVFKMPEEMKKRALQAVNQGIETLKAVSIKLIKDSNSADLSAQAEKMAADKINPWNLALQIDKLTENGKINLDLFNNKYDKFDNRAASAFIETIEKVFPGSSKTVQAAIEEQKTIDNYSSAAENTAKKLLQPIFLPLRAKVTFLAIPPLLGFLGLKKPAKNSGKKLDKQPAEQIQKQQKNFGSLNQAVLKNNGSEIFKPFQEGRN